MAEENIVTANEPGSEEISKSQSEFKTSLDNIGGNLNKISENVEITRKTTQIIEANQYYQRNWENMRGEFERIAKLN